VPTIISILGARRFLFLRRFEIVFGELVLFHQAARIG
jgi:hypothetical protein